MATNSQIDKMKKWLWPNINDSSSALDAMKLAQWVGLIIAIGYGMTLLLAFGTNQYPDGSVFESDDELYGIVFMSLVLMIVALVFLFLARRGLSWAVLALSAWGLIEAVLKVLSISGGGIILTILLILFCISGIRGWLGIRKYGRPVEAKAAG